MVKLFEVIEDPFQPISLDDQATSEYNQKRFKAAKALKKRKLTKQISDEIGNAQLKQRWKWVLVGGSSYRSIKMTMGQGNITSVLNSMVSSLYAFTRHPIEELLLFSKYGHTACEDATYFLQRGNKELQDLKYALVSKVHGRSLHANSIVWIYDDLTNNGPKGVLITDAPIEAISLHLNYLQDITDMEDPSLMARALTGEQLYPDNLDDL